MKYLLLSLTLLTFQCHADTLLCTHVSGTTTCTGTTDGSVHVSSSSCSDGALGTTSCTGDNIQQNPGMLGNNGGEFDREDK